MKKHSKFTLSEKKLLQSNFQELDLKIKNPQLSQSIQIIHQELKNLGFVHFQVKFYFGPEWFCPEESYHISIPFYFANKKLLRLEKKIMIDVEGGSQKEMLQLMRHECGHAFEHAYRLTRSPEYKKIFGNPRQNYQPETYKSMPYSKRFVQYLDNYYAQAHPTEDFAESFAVIMDPQSDWKKKYARWPLAFRKLNYIEKKIQLLQKKKPSLKVSRPLAESRKSVKTLEKHYKLRKEQLSDDYPAFHDADLKTIFKDQRENSSSSSQKRIPAWKMLEKNQKTLSKELSFWTGEKQFIILKLIKRLTLRAKLLQLHSLEKDQETLFSLSAFLSTIITNYLHTGRFKRKAS